MITRRLLRIKTMQILYSFFKSDEQSIIKAEKELFFSVHKSYELYHYLILLMIDVTNFAQKKIDHAKDKRISTYEDLNPNTKFAENKLITQLKENQDFITFTEANRMSWVNYPELIKKVFAEITASDSYKDYMKSNDNSYDYHKKFILHIIKNQIANTELLYQILEEQSIYWNDDVDLMISMVVKTLKGFSVGDDSQKPLMSLFKDTDDQEFVKKLFRKTIANHKEYWDLIKSFTKNWDVDRISFIDVLIIELAINEAVEFPSIPIKVSLNEFIEIAKLYGSKKSSNFVNGILDKIIVDLKSKDKIKKAGRGLV